MKRRSKIIVPNDPGFVTSVIAYCAELARKAGFTEKETEGIGTALKEACENVIAHAFNPFEDESFTVTFELTGEGMLIVVDEMGMPFPAGLSAGADTPGIRAMEENMDSVTFVNRGREGKEVRMFKFRKGAHVEEIFSAEELTPYAACDLPGRDVDVTLRLMRPEEAAQVSRCIFRAYRYTYLNEDLYFPDRIEARNREGQMISAVAAVPGAGGDDEIIGHFALTPRPNGKAAEIGVAVVSPRYRGRGLMKKLLGFLVDVAAERGFSALYGNAFTMHVLSQRTNLDFGFSETALMLGAIPPRSIQPLCELDLKGAGCSMTFFNYIGRADRFKVYLPPRHQEMCDEIYGRLALVRTFAAPEGAGARGLPAESDLELQIRHNHRVAVITVRSAGRDLADRVKAKRMELADKGFNVLFVDLALNDPATPEATGMVEAVGFFFCGVLPDYSDGDVLRLQYCITEIIYDEVQAYSEFAGRLKDYVRNLDPKWKALH